MKNALFFGLGFVCGGLTAVELARCKLMAAK